MTTNRTKNDLATDAESQSKMQRQPRADLKPWFLTLDDLVGPIDSGQLFDEGRPIEIDVGSGRGLFLVNAAESNPETNYLGIEIDYREGRRAARRLQKREMSNARVLGGDVARAFDRFVRPGSVAAVHVYFPDPWWKKKHKKRRVFTDQLADRMARVLEPGGFVHSWTDVAEYFEVIRGLMDHHADFEVLQPPAERPAGHDLDYRTSFERKKRKEGQPIYRGLWRRKGFGNQS